MTDPGSSTSPAVPITTALAFERTRVAYERTMMAWIRTATSLITFGFSVYKFFEIEMRAAAPAPMLLGPRGFGIALIVTGLVSLLLGAFEHGRDLRGLGERYAGMPRSMSAWVALIVGGLGVFALAAVFLRA